MGGMEWGALEWPSVQLKLMVAWPLLVVSLREAFPCRAQKEMNSFTEVVRNWEFNLADIFERVLITILQQQGSPCELNSSFHRHMSGAHHTSCWPLTLSSGKEVPALSPWDLYLNLLLPQASNLNTAVRCGKMQHS